MPDMCHYRLPVRVVTCMRKARNAAERPPRFLNNTKNDRFFIDTAFALADSIDATWGARAVAPFADAQQFLLTTGGTLPRDHPDPCGQVSAFPKCRSIAHCGDQRRGCRGPDPRNGREPWASFVGLERLVRKSNCIEFALLEVPYCGPYTNKLPPAENA